MVNERMTDEAARALGTWLKSQGLSGSADPNKAVRKASKGRLCFRRDRDDHILRLCSNDSRPWPTEEDIPLIEKAAQMSGRGDWEVFVRSTDGRLRTWYKLSKDGHMRLHEYAPADSYVILRAICRQPVGVLVKYEGIHPDLDAFIHRRLREPQGGTTP